jgi:long-subunit acyl-CoA synthetase (AMP-forming)
MAASPPSPCWVSDLESTRPIIGQDAGYARGTTTPMLLKAAAERRGGKTFFVTSDGDAVSGADFYSLSRRVAKGIVAADVAPGHGICIVGGNSVEWFAADWGAMLASTLPSPSYVSNSAEILAYIMDHSRSCLCFVDDEETMTKAIAARAQMSGDTLRSIVVWGPQIDLSRYRDHASYLLTWEEFLATGDGVSDGEIDERMALARPESCAKLIYTSGTTGPPKAVMISHDNLYYIGQVTVREYGITDQDTTVSYLPASHIAANSLDCMGPIVGGVTVYLAQPDALRGSLVETLRAVRPTCFFAVPRVWEKIQERMVGMRTTMGPLKRLVSNWAKSVGAAASNAEDAGGAAPLGAFLAEQLVFANVRRALGLDRARLIFNTAAPLQPSTSDYFRSLRIKILDVSLRRRRARCSAPVSAVAPVGRQCTDQLPVSHARAPLAQVYGMSEATGSFTTTRPDHYRRGSVGTACKGIEVKLHKRDESTGEGELCFRGRNVFLGYLGDAAESEATLDDDGFIHTGDLATMDADGFVHITGRAKELIVTSGGENVAPSLIESALLSAMPAICRAFAVGDARKYVSCLLVPFMDEAGQLTGPAALVSPHARAASDAVGDSAWTAYVKDGIAEASKSAISSVAKVKRFSLLTEDFSVQPRRGCAKGELTPTLKVMRKAVVQNYAPVIDAMYARRE